MIKPSTLDRLFAQAAFARERAYAPYSGFRVGAALASAEGAFHSGCNVENAAYPVGLCAEAGAIAAMAAAGGRLIADIAILGPDGAAPCFPCGACRQRIREFSDAATRIHVRSAAGVESFAIDALLPRAFGPNDLARRN